LRDLTLIELTVDKMYLEQTMNGQCAFMYFRLWVVTRSYELNDSQNSTKHGQLIWPDERKTFKVGLRYLASLMGNNGNK